MADDSDTTVLVTGISGFIAMHCALALLRSGYRVRGTLRTPSRGDAIRATLERELGEPVGDRLLFARADLMKDDGWSDAVDGCRYVLHVASPLPRTPPKHEDELIVPARDGALRVLRAATEAGVQRVVMTSSVAAVLYGHPRDGSRVFDEADWSKLTDDVGAYEKSKTIAERAAWDFVQAQPEAERLELVTINPGLVLGPVLDEDYGTSGEVVRKLMKRDFPACPDVGWAVVDVRDVADAHLAALRAPDAAGKRFICAIEHASMRDVAKILAEHFDGRYRVPTGKLPDWALRLVSVFDKTARLAVGELGKRQNVSNQRARDLLGWQPRSLREMVVDMGESFVQHGVV